MTYSNEKPRILAIDDNSQNLSLLSCMLDLTDCDSYMETDSSNGLTAALNFQPHVILLDIVMPDPDGLEVYRQIKSHSQTREIPIIFNSTNDDCEFNRIRKLGVEDFINKPFDLEEIVSVINRYLPEKIALKLPNRN